MFEWHKKEKPFLGMAGLGGGVVSKLVGSSAAALGATGGFINNYTVSGTHYRCLLYTSPSPRDQRGSRMPSSA